jgi:8-oxo-dGTP pyrophosphatase MutT (NUDIX family)
MTDPARPGSESWWKRLGPRLLPPPPLSDVPRAFAPERPGDHALNPGAGPIAPAALTPAAVLVPLVAHDDGVRVLLTRRTDRLSHHSGQISFPGGRVDEGDRDLVACALREAEEEIGLDRRFVRVLGALDCYITVTGFAVTPLVAAVTPGFRLRIDPAEVAEAFDVPLEFLLDPANHRRHGGVFNGVQRHWWAMPYGDYYIWGATAGMLRNLHERLTGKD